MVVGTAARPTTSGRTAGLQEAEQQPEAPKKVDISIHGAGGDGDGSAGADSPYGDAETHAFYEVLPDLRSVLPAVLFGEVERGGEVDEQQKRLIEGLMKMVPQLASRQETDDLASELVCKGAKSHRRLIVKGLTSPPPKRP